MITAFFPRKNDENVNASNLEEKRKQKMKRNAEFLATLGIKPKSKTVGKQRKFIASKRRRPPLAPSGSAAVRRRSGRLQKKPIPEPRQTPKTVASPEKPKTYVDSSVHQYLWSPMNQTNMAQTFTDPTLKRIYSIDFGPKAFCPLLVAGGHQGYVRVHGTQTTGDDEMLDSTSLMTFRAHRGWVASVSLGLSEQGSTRLLTAANDGLVKLWDIEQTAIEEPKELDSTETLHSNGIFSMHVWKRRIYTASKDGCVVVSKATNDSIRSVSTFDLEMGILKCVECRRDEALFAVCGNAGLAQMLDARAGTEVNRIQPQRISGALNSITWHPSREHQMCLSGFDPMVELWDVRHTGTPLASLGSCIGAATRNNTIYCPRYNATGTRLLVCFPKERGITQYDTETFKGLHHGHLEYQPITCQIDENENIALSSTTGDIHCMPLQNLEDAATDQKQILKCRD